MLIASNLREKSTYNIETQRIQGCEGIQPLCGWIIGAEDMTTVRIF